MSKRAQIHDWCQHFCLYFAGWCAFETLVATMFIFLHKKTADTIWFMSVSAAVALVYFAIVIYIINGKRRTEERQTDSADLEFVIRRGEERSHRSDIRAIVHDEAQQRKASSDAIVSISTNGIRYEMESKQFAAMMAMHSNLTSIVDENKKRDEKQSKKDNEICLRLSNLDRKVDNISEKVDKKKARNNKASSLTKSLPDFSKL